MLIKGDIKPSAGAANAYGPLLFRWINFNLSMDKNNNEWDEITYPFPNFNDRIVEFWESMSNFIPHFLGVWLFVHTGIKVKPC